MLKNKASNLFWSISVQDFFLLKRKLVPRSWVKVKTISSSRILFNLELPLEEDDMHVSLHSSTLSHSFLLLLFVVSHHQSFSLWSEKYLNFTFALLALSNILSFPNFTRSKFFNILRRIIKIMFLYKLEYSRFW